jgi:Leucine-rich repeat (LRR) protein
LAGRGLTTAPIERFLEVASGGVDGVSWFEVVDLNKLDLSHNRITAVGLGTHLAALRSLKTLNLQHNPLGECPDAVFALAGLKALDVSSCELYGELPAGLGALGDALVSLAASSNGLIDATHAFTGGLRQLKILRLGQNLIESLPVRGPYTAQLLSLDLSSNRLTDLPDAFCAGVGASLESLDLSDNMLTQFPPSIVELVRLQTLAARGNALTGNLSFLPRSEALHTLMLGRNKLQSIGVDDAFLASLVQLSVLDLSENKIRELPEGMGALGRLKTLDVSMNRLSTIPIGLGYIASLTRIALEGNMLRAIRPGIRNAGGEKLKAYLRSRGPPHPRLPEAALVGGSYGGGGGNGNSNGNGNGSGGSATALLLASIVARSRSAHGSGVLDYSDLNLPVSAVLADPHNDAFAAIEQALLRSNGGIHTLRMNQNTLSGELPAAFAQMISHADELHTLCLDDNALSALSPALSTASLSEITCAENEITAGALSNMLLPEDAVTGSTTRLCHTLRNLNLRRNKLDHIPDVVFRCCSRLERLSLGGNRLSNVSSCPWERMARLNELDLSACGLRDIPEVFHELPVLHVLDLSNNDLGGLPITLALSRSLKALRIEGNPIRSIRHEVLRGGTDRVLQFLGNKFPVETQSAVEAARAARRFAEPGGGGGGGSGGNDKDGGGSGRDGGGGGGSSAAVLALESELSRMEAECASQGLSKMQQYAANKKIKMVKAKLIRTKRAETAAAASARK